jgi:hypothetical protein
MPNWVLPWKQKCTGKRVSAALPDPKTCGREVAQHVLILESAYGIIQCKTKRQKCPYRKRCIRAGPALEVQTHWLWPGRFFCRGGKPNLDTCPHGVPLSRNNRTRRASRLAKPASQWRTCGSRGKAFTRKSIPYTCWPVTSSGNSGPNPVPHGRSSPRRKVLTKTLGRRRERFWLVRIRPEWTFPRRFLTTLCGAENMRQWRPT